MLPPLPLACYPETWISLNFSLLPYTLSLWGLFVACVVSPIKIKLILFLSTHSTPLMSTFCYYITLFQSPRRRRLISFSLIRHSFAISPALILSFPFPLTHAGSMCCEISCTEYERATQRLVHFLVFSAFPSSSSPCTHQSSLRLISFAFGVKSFYTALEASHKIYLLYPFELIYFSHTNLPF